MARLSQSHPESRGNAFSESLLKKSEEAARRAIRRPWRLASLAVAGASFIGGPVAAEGFGETAEGGRFRLIPFAHFGIGIEQPNLEAALGSIAQEPVSGEPKKAVTSPREKHFFAAAGGVLLLEVLPWAYNRYAEKDETAFISFETIKQNFKTGPKYDSDSFRVNQSSHPYHGGLFFDAARANGYGYWASGLFTMAGSLMWECCMENTAPSINDFVNTTLGGMSRGEVAHRASVMILDNTASGFDRVWREAAAAIINPVGAIYRLFRGEMTHDRPNPEDRFPHGFSLAVDGGYRQIRGGGQELNQWVLSVSALYGNPFAGDIRNPFDTFWVGIDLNSPGGAPFSRIEERGILKGWELTDPDSAARHIFGFSQEYEYLNNKSQVFGAQMFGMGVLSRYQLRSRWTAVTDVTVLALPLAGIQTTDVENPQTGRNYDYAPGAGVRAEGRVYLGAREILGGGYGYVFASTANGSSISNTLQFFRAVARLPLSGSVSAGAAYAWYRRKTRYSHFFEPPRTQNEARVFVNWVFPNR